MNTLIYPILFFILTLHSGECSSFDNSSSLHTSGIGLYHLEILPRLLPQLLYDKHNLTHLNFTFEYWIADNPDLNNLTRPDDLMIVVEGCNVQVESSFRKLRRGIADFDSWTNFDCRRNIMGFPFHDPLLPLTINAIVPLNDDYIGLRNIEVALEYADGDSREYKCRDPNEVDSYWACNAIQISSEKKLTWSQKPNL